MDILHTISEAVRMNRMQMLRQRREFLSRNPATDYAPQEHGINAVVANSTRRTNADGQFSSEHDAAYQWLQQHHPDIHQYIRVDAPIPIDPIQTKMAVQSMGRDQTMRILKVGVQNDIRGVWKSAGSAPPLPRALAS